MDSASEESFLTLPLGERLSHKSWKARQQGYNELMEVFEKASVVQIEGSVAAKYWKAPELFASYVTDGNVVAQESAVKALLSLVSYMAQIAGIREMVDIAQLVSVWVPVLVEKGTTATKSATREAAVSCIVTLASMDDSIAGSLESLSGMFEKKLPKLLTATLTVHVTLIEQLGFVNMAEGKRRSVIQELVAVLPKLCSHADKNVRNESMNLILQLYTWFDKPLLQELLLGQLKPIQQKELDKLFESYTGSIPPSTTARLLTWAAKPDPAGGVDVDGDAIMMQASSGDAGASSSLGNGTGPGGGAPIDPYDMYPVQTILDKLPADFYRSLSSSKWKDRVDALEEFHDQALAKVRKLSAAREDYSELIHKYCSIITSDANLQAVQISTNSLNILITALREEFLPFASEILNALLTRSKEKKPSVADSIFATLLKIAQYYGIESCLEPTLAHMNNKVPQVKVICSKFLFALLSNWTPDAPPYKTSVFSNLPHILKALLPIVNDNQQSTRNEGFKCVAILIKIFDQREVAAYLDKLDNLKKKKILELVDEVEVKVGPPSDVRPPQQGGLQRAPTLVRASTSKATAGSNSTIPSKRLATSPLKPERKSSLNVGKSSRLTSRSLTTPQQLPHPTYQSASSSQAQSLKTGSAASARMSLLNEEVNALRQERQEWLRERNELMSNLNQSKLQISKLNKQLNESEGMVSTLQRQLNDSNAEKMARDLKIKELENKLNSSVQSAELKPVGSPASINRGRLTSTTLSPLRSSTNLTPQRMRSPSESSDDLPRRVNSLNLNNHALQEESWKRAAEVTNQLKARIERMRAKSRSGFNDST